MPDKPTCQECGAELPANAPQGLCPRCLAGMALNLAAAAKESADDRDAPAPRQRSPTTKPRIRYFGDYELLEEIARGGMGVVYRARQVSLNRIVAVKMLLFGKFSSDEFVQRFQTEAQAVASLQHPNIVAIHEVGEHEGQHYFSMDYIEGKSLAELARESPLSARRAAGYIKTIAEAIHYAHQRGILHRDLKPSNVLIDKFDQPRITDFGLAKQLTSGSELTVTGQVLGSPNYMPPEQADAKRGAVGVYSDVYSLGAILYYLLTRCPPVLGETLEDTLLQLLDAEPISPRLLNASVPRDLETVCLKCLEKNPRRRFETAQALADELGRYLHSEPILTRSAGPAEKVWRWCRRQPAIASLVGGLALVLMTGLGGVLLEWQQAEKHRIRAEERAEGERQLKYAGDMNLALLALEDGNPAQALQFLLRHRPKPGESDLRGFEWRHLWWRCRGDSELALPKHNQVVGAMAFSPDGKLLATYCWDDTLRLWNLDSKATILTVTNAASLGGFAEDGRQFVFGQRDGSVSSYRLATGQRVSLLPNVGELVAMAANGKSAATIDREQRLKVWDLVSRQIRFAVPDPVRRRLDYGWGAGVAIAPDGNVLAVVEQSKSSGHADPRITLWDIRAAAELKSLPADRQVRCLSFSPDGKLLVMGDGAGTIWSWSMATFESKSFPAHTAPILSVAFSPDSGTLASGSSDQTIKLWDLPSLAEKRRTLRGQVGAVWSLVFSPDGQRLASGSRDTSPRIWDLKGQQLPTAVNDLYSVEWGNFTFSPDSKLMAAGCKDNNVRVWEVETLELKGLLPGAMFAVAFSKDAKTLLTSGEDELPRWWNLETQTAKSIPAYHGKLTGVVFCVDLSPDRRVAALGFNNGNIQLLEIESGRQLALFLAHTGGVASVAFAPPGDKLVSGGRDKAVAIWDVQTQRNLAHITEHRGSVCAIAISPAGNQLASGCSANTIKFWNPSDMKKSLKSVSYHESVIRTLCFSPDGKTLASGSEDDTVKLWNVGTCQEVGSFKCHDHVRLVLFSPDGNNLAIVTDHGRLQLLRATPLDQADREAETLLK